MNQLWTGSSIEHLRLARSLFNDAKIISRRFCFPKIRRNTRTYMSETAYVAKFLAGLEYRSAPPKRAMEKTQPGNTSNAFDATPTRRCLEWVGEEESDSWDNDNSRHRKAMIIGVLSSDDGLNNQSDLAWR
ncbi:hypothetical protein PM082_021863 [Marasmius tenuissimus]|nr:hypothetical protein PM082_021863 [Marasmius tenuissimus]